MIFFGDAFSGGALKFCNWGPRAGTVQLPQPCQKCAGWFIPPEMDFHIIYTDIHIFTTGYEASFFPLPVALLHLTQLEMKTLAAISDRI